MVIGPGHIPVAKFNQFSEYYNQDVLKELLGSSLGGIFRIASTVGGWRPLLAITKQGRTKTATPRCVFTGRDGTPKMIASSFCANNGWNSMVGAEGPH